MADDSLVKLARQRFPRWTLGNAEASLIQNAADGMPFDGVDAKQSIIRAPLIRWLCGYPDAVRQVHPAGLHLRAATVAGPLLMSGMNIPFRLAFWSCVFDSDAEFRTTQLLELDLSGTSARAILADRVMVKGAVFMRDGFRCAGGVRVAGGTIGGDLDFTAATITCSPVPEQDGRNRAIFAQRMTIAGSVFLREGFTAQGEVTLSGSTIKGDVDCVGGTFARFETSSSADALTIEGASISGGVFCFSGEKRAPFEAKGRFSLVAAKVDRELNLTGNFQSATLDLRDTSAGVLIDSGPDFWPKHGNLLLEGFVYGRIGPGPVTGSGRLIWIRRDAYFSSQPYRQLAKVLTESGDDMGARDVLEALETARITKKEGPSMIRRLRTAPVQAIAGYGYAPYRAGWWFLGLGLFGWLLYRRSYLAGQMTPSDKEAYGEFKKTGMPPLHYRGFSPLAYSFENSFPLVKLGQSEKWNPDPCQTPPAAAAPVYRFHDKKRVWPKRLRPIEQRLIRGGLRPDPAGVRKPSGPSGAAMRWFLWIQIILGWIFATLFVAGVTGLLKKN